VSEAAAARPDLRLVPAAIATWAGVFVGVIVPGLVLAGLCVVVAAGVLGVARLVIGQPARLAALAALACLLGGILAGGGRAATLRAGPVDELADERAAVGVDAVVTTDPQPRPAEGGRPAYVIAHLRIESIAGRGTTTAVRTPVLLLASNSDWIAMRPGQSVSVAGRLAPAERSGDVAALLRVRDPPDVLGPPGRLSRLTEPLRAGLREAVDGLGEGPRGLVPALVVGDESRLPLAVQADMEATGLTHLTAVSGDNVG
jgi:competence protein ComEC